MISKTDSSSLYFVFPKIAPLSNALCIPIPVRMVLLRGEFTLHSFLIIIENWSRMSSIPYEREINSDVHNFILQHDMGRNFSFLVKELYRYIFEEIFEIKSDFTLSSLRLEKVNNLDPIVQNWVSMSVFLGLESSEHTVCIGRLRLNLVPPDNCCTIIMSGLNLNISTPAMLIIWIITIQIKKNLQVPTPNCY